MSNVCLFVDQFKTGYDTKWHGPGWIHRAAMWSMVKCQRIPNNRELMARYTSCLKRRSPMQSRRKNLPAIYTFLEISKPTSPRPSTSNKLDFLISVPVKPVEASCNWFHFVLLLDNHRPELPNRARLIRQRPITSWNWVCIGDAFRVIRLKSQPSQFTRFVIYQEARN